MMHKSLNLRILLPALSILFSISLFGQPSADNGKTLFRNKCAACHSRDMKTNSTGPALAGTEERWADYPREDLINWINNSQALIAAGHPKAVELWNEYKPTVMTAAPELTTDDVESILLHINEVANAVPVEAVSAVSSDGEASADFTKYMYWGLFVILLVLAFILSRVIGSLNQIAEAKEGKHVPPKTVFEFLTSKSVINIVLFILVLLGGYTTVNNAVNLGRQQGYTPDQPIAFSHATHAGLHKIDCQYCHDGARRSKHSVIPAANTCMNCHIAIKNGSTYGTGEITKIYASIGFDPNGTGGYIDGYDEMSNEDIAAIYKKWIGDQYMDTKGSISLGREGERFVDEQWENVVESLTNEQKKSIGGGIEWTRVHNLPDHVYFNHSQHVTVGKLECQTCHGKVEEMEVVEQFSPLSMGWCVNCHRQTEVEFAGNPYYKSYNNYHQELASGKRDKVTVEDIGGLECQKCHY